MEQQNKFNPTGRFSGLADIYAKSRPSYPEDALDFIVKHCGLREGATMVDVGCGTGISTRLFAERKLKLLGIEPNDDMRQKAQSHENSQFAYAPVYVKATAEHTQLGDASCDAVLCAQAFHWFNKEACLKEFSRILKEDSFVVLMWNERNEEDGFTKAYGDVLQTWPETASVELPRRKSGMALLESPLFKAKERYNFYNEQLVDEQGMIGRAFSASYAPKDTQGRKHAEEALSAVFRKHEKDGSVIFRYETSVYVGQKI